MEPQVTLLGKSELYEEGMLRAPVFFSRKMNDGTRSRRDPLRASDRKSATASNGSTSVRRNLRGRHRTSVPLRVSERGTTKGVDLLRNHLPLRIKTD